MKMSWFKNPFRRRERTPEVESEEEKLKKSIAKVQSKIAALKELKEGKKGNEKTDLEIELLQEQLKTLNDDLSKL
jgi:phosphoenolpyruvate-protein kinase (PTS system EI component)